VPGCRGRMRDVADLGGARGKAATPWHIRPSQLSTRAPLRSSGGGMRLARHL